MFQQNAELKQLKKEKKKLRKVPQFHLNKIKREHVRWNFI